MNIDPTLWGPSVWRSLHYITLGYPDTPTERHVRSARDLFTSLGSLLPCEKCRTNFVSHLATHPLSDAVLSTRQTLVRWLIDFHNDVNRSIGKPIMSYDEALRMYPLRASDWWDLRVVTIVILVLLIIIMIVVMRYMR